MSRDRKILIGTSGWHYSHWRGPFYPADMPAEKYLRYYAGIFDTVEINNSFYRLPEAETFAEWRDSVPRGFVFTVKASRYITHMKKLKDATEPVENFIERASVLGEKLGPILFQLPPRWKINADRLTDFLSILPEGLRYAFEFRDSTWFHVSVYEALTKQGAAFCIFDLDRNLSPKKVTADFVYVRLHGPDGAYRGSYPEKTLKEWAEDIKGWRKEGRDVYIYFDNDEAGYAAADAMRLRKLANC